MNFQELSKKYFPQSFKTDTGKDLLVTVIVYIIISVIGSIVCGLLDGLPLIGFVFSILGSLISLYTSIGIILAVLNFFGVLKK